MRSEKPTITIIINNLIISPQKWSAICRARDMKLYIISNRLPVKVSEKNGTFSFTRSEGGLATGLDSLQTAYEKHWIGWPGICVDNDSDKQAIGEKLEELNFHPVFLSDTQIKNYYEGYSNSTIWPLCHYFFAYTLYKDTFWQAYQVNPEKRNEPSCKNEVVQNLQKRSVQKSTSAQYKKAPKKTYFFGAFLLLVFWLSHQKSLTLNNKEYIIFGF